MLELRPNQDVDVTAKGCFSLDNEACLIFQKYDEGRGDLSMFPYRTFNTRIKSKFMFIIVLSNNEMQGSALCSTNISVDNYNCTNNLIKAA